MRKAVLIIFSTLVVLSVAAFFLISWNNARIPHLLSEAEAAWQDGRVREAQDLLRQAHTKDQNNVEVLRQLAEIAREEGRYAEAADLWARVARLNPGDSDALHMEAMNWLASGRPVAVIELLEPELEAKSLTALDQLLLARAYMQDGRLEKGLAVLEALPEPIRQDPSARLLLAHAAFARGDTDEARALYEQVEGSDMDRSAALVGLANCLLLEGRTEEAEPLMIDAIRLSDNAYQSAIPLASLYRRQGRFRDEAALWEQLLDKYPDTPEVIVPLAECYAAEERTDDLQTLISEFNALGTLRVDSKHYLEALKFYCEGDFEQALQYLDWSRNEMKNRPLFQWIEFHSALLNRDLAKTRESLARLEQGQAPQATKDEAIRVMTEQVMLAGMQGDGEFVEGVAQEIARRRPDNPVATMVLARKALNEMRFGYVLKAADNILEQNPDDVTALELRGRAHMKMGNYEQAREDFNAIQRAAPDLQVGPYWMGVLLLREGDMDGSREMLEYARGMDSNDVRTATGLYDVYDAQGDMEAIRMLAAELLRTNNRLLKSVGHSFLAGIARKNGDTAEAAEQYRFAIEESPDRIPYYLMRADYLMELNRFDEAMNVLLAARNLAPDNKYVRFNLALCEDRSGHDMEAIKRYQRLCEAYPRWALPQANLAQVLARQEGMFQSAKDAAERAIDLSPKWWEAHFALALALEASGDTEEAIQALENAEDLAPGNTQVENLLRELRETREGA